MNLDQLRSFLAVADEGSFTKASKKTFVAQPALTRQIARLEDEVGARLFDRSTRNVSLTPHGATFLPAAREAVAAIDKAMSGIRAEDRRREGALTVGFVYLYLSQPAEAWVDDYRASRRDVSVKVVENDPESLLQMLEDGRVDAAFLGMTDTSLVSPSLSKFPIATIREWVLTGRDHPLASRIEATADDLAGEKLVYPYIKPQPLISPLQRDLADRGIEVEYVQAGFDRDVFQIVESGQAVTVLPGTHRPIDRDIVAIPYRSEHVNRTYLIWNPSNEKKVLADFISYASARAGEIV